MHIPFPALLAQHIARLGWSHRAFARKLGRSNGFVSQIIRGERLPPLDLIESWGDELGLSTTERDAFILEAKLEHCPESISASYRELLQTNAALADKVEEFKKQIAQERVPTKPRDRRSEKVANPQSKRSKRPTT